MKIQSALTKRYIQTPPSPLQARAAPLKLKPIETLNNAQLFPLLLTSQAFNELPDDTASRRAGRGRAIHFQQG